MLKRISQGQTGGPLWTAPIVDVVCMFSVVIWLCLVVWLHQSPVCMCWLEETERTNKTSKLGSFTLLLDLLEPGVWYAGVDLCHRGRVQCPEPGLGFGGQPWRKVLGLVQKLVGGHCSMALWLEQPAAGSALISSLLIPWHQKIHCPPFPYDAGRHYCPLGTRFGSKHI